MCARAAIIFSVRLTDCWSWNFDRSNRLEIAKTKTEFSLFLFFGFRFFFYLEFLFWIESDLFSPFIKSFSVEKHEENRKDSSEVLIRFDSVSKFVSASTKVLLFDVAAKSGSMRTRFSSRFEFSSINTVLSFKSEVLCWRSCFDMCLKQNFLVITFFSFFKILPNVYRWIVAFLTVKDSIVHVTFLFKNEKKRHVDRSFFCFSLDEFIYLQGDNRIWISIMSHKNINGIVER